jgi:hypothetical protein
MEVVKGRRVGGCLFLIGKGLTSRTFYENALSPDQFEQVEVITGARTAFSAGLEAFFLDREVLPMVEMG